MLLAGMFFPLCAEVYWLGPGRRGGSGSDRLPGILPGMEKVLYTSRISVNSFPATVKVSAVRGDIEEIVLQLKKLKVDNLNVSGGTVRFERKPGPDLRAAGLGKKKTRKHSFCVSRLL